MKKTKTLLLLGDVKDFDEYSKLKKQKRFLYKSKIAFKTTDYASILEGKMPGVNTNELIIFPCFPFKYWDRNIETKTYRGVYGNMEFFEKFVRFWKVIGKKLDREYAGKKVSYVNQTGRLAADRDKRETARVLSAAGIPVAKSLGTRKAERILKLLEDGSRLFVKVRYGSMGKGITYLEKGRWMTNFRFVNGRILSRKSDRGWTFRKVTGNKGFLRKLLKEDVVIEEAAESLLVNGRKFDMRMYVFNGRVAYSYGRSNRADAVTTNISQGALGESSNFIRKLPPRQVRKAKRNAVKAVNAMGLGFALSLCEGTPL